MEMLEHVEIVIILIFFSFSCDLSVLLCFCGSDMGLHTTCLFLCHCGYLEEPGMRFTN